MNKLLRSTLLTLLALIVLVSPVLAQENSSSGPIYVVKAGDTLWTIARKFYVSYDELLAVNELNASSSIIPGNQLVIPGLEDFGGIIDTVQVPFGENLESISRRYQVPTKDLIRINRCGLSDCQYW